MHGEYNVKAKTLRQSFILWVTTSRVALHGHEHTTFSLIVDVTYIGEVKGKMCICVRRGVMRRPALMMGTTDRRLPANGRSAVRCGRDVGCTKWRAEGSFVVVQDN